MSLHQNLLLNSLSGGTLSFAQPASVTPPCAATPPSSSHSPRPCTAHTLPAVPACSCIRPGSEPTHLRCAPFTKHTANDTQAAATKGQSTTAPWLDASSLRAAMQQWLTTARQPCLWSSGLALRATQTHMGGRCAGESWRYSCSEDQGSRSCTAQATASQHTSPLPARSPPFAPLSAVYPTPPGHRRACRGGQRWAPPRPLRAWSPWRAA